MIKIHIFLLIFVNLIYIINCKPPFQKNAKQNCGYQSCHPTSTDKLNVHLVAHSHDDVGWLKTVDQYFYGSRSNIQQAGVQYIIGSVVDALQSNPDRRFIQVETAFFWKWWNNQSDRIKDVVKNLINNGQLEIINGAWSMNDEAATHYQSIIDQFTLGLRTINETLGECAQPKVGWQIDPFGHSREMASLFSQLGYEAMFFARLDYRDNSLRHNTSTLEMIWQGSPNLGKSSNLFTGVLYDFYTTPAYFCWDVLCSDMPIFDDEESPDYNEDQIVGRFADYAIKGAKYFQTQNLLVTMGGDFTYQAAEMFYNNMDKLIKGFAKHRPDINIIYSTPSCYVKAVNEESIASAIKFPLKTDDFFPYASDEHSYWTGYFTSRPNSKRFERQGNNILQVVKHLTTFEKMLTQKDYSSNITLLKEAMGIMQHHDAITGTEKQHVVDDYVRIMTKAIERSETNIDDIIVDLLRKDSNTNTDDVKVKLGSCLMANASFCEASNSDRFTIAVYNPLSRNVSHYIRLPVDGSQFKITAPNGADMEYDVSPAISNFTSVSNMTSLSNDLVFLAANIPALGLKLFYVEKLAVDVVKASDSNVAKKKNKKYRLGTETTGFEIDESTGLLCTVTLNKITLPVRQEFMYYHGANGSNYGAENRASGAYIFRPANVTPSAVPVTDIVQIKVFQGKFVDEAHQTFNPWIKQIIRIYKNENYIEFDWIIGPIDISSKLGVEVISRFSTDLKTNKTFYTDSNGREMIKRVRDFRDTYEYTDEEPVAGNYYPVTSRIALKDIDNNIELAVLNDRAQGGSSLQDGELELMVHRRLLNDDAFGVGEALNELEYGIGVQVRGQHYLTFDALAPTNNKKSAAAQQRDLAQKKLLSPWVFVGNASADQHSLENLKEKLYFKFSGLTRNLPENVQILTLEPWSNGNVLLRLEHVLEKDEDLNLSKPVEVDLNDLFTLFNITSMRETTLGANQWIEDNKKLDWNIGERSETYKENKVDDFKNDMQIEMDIKQAPLKNKNDLLVILNPMQIRTFILSV